MRKKRRKGKHRMFMKEIERSREGGQREREKKEREREWLIVSASHVVSVAKTINCSFLSITSSLQNIFKLIFPLICHFKLEKKMKILKFILLKIVDPNL